MGAFFATGLFMLLIGLTGGVRTAMALIPMPIVMAMVAGVFLRFGTNLVLAMRDDALIAAPSRCEPLPRPTDRVASPGGNTCD